MRKKFIDKKFSQTHLDIINKANLILDEYQQIGLVVTLRQLYYQFVARDLFPTDRRYSKNANDKWVSDPLGTPNTDRNYDWLGGIISDARLAGLIDWDTMEDRVRSLQKISAWSSPEEIIEVCADQYKEDLWRNQPRRPEVWIEKDALVGVIEQSCRDLRVPFFACRGYTSQSAQYEAGRRFQRYIANGQRPIVLHLGDHDPSGLDMTRDNRERLELFSQRGVELRRLALTMDQIEQYNPPPNPAKESDGRAAAYIEEYGRLSWELDALDPSVIGALIRDNINPLIYRSAWNAAEQRERENRELLQKAATHWPSVGEHLNTL